MKDLLDLIGMAVVNKHRRGPADVNHTPKSSFSHFKKAMGFLLFNQRMPGYLVRSGGPVSVKVDISFSFKLRNDWRFQLSEAAFPHALL